MEAYLFFMKHMFQKETQLEMHFLVHIWILRLIY